MRECGSTGGREGRSEGVQSEEREVQHQWSLLRDTNSSTLLNKLVDFVRQTRRLCIVIERCLDCDAYVEDEPTTISQLSPDDF